MPYFLAVLTTLAGDRYGLTSDQILEAETALEELAAQAQSRLAEENVLPLIDIMGLLLLLCSLQTVLL